MNPFSQLSGRPRAAPRKDPPAAQAMLPSPAPVEWQEIRRIIGLPMVLPFESEEVEEFNRTHVLAKPFDEGWRLWPVQCEAIAAYLQYDGLFSPIGVGWGKTLITQCIANEAYRKGLKKIMLLIPSSVLDQLVRDQFPLARGKVPINYPLLVMGGKTSARRRALAHSGKRGLYIMPYSCLSLKDTVECLEAIAPELIICDEADHLGNRTSARTKRIMSYVDKFKPEGAVLSGTITRDSLSDYAHLIKWVLGLNSPLPLSAHLADDWGARIDAKATETKSEATGPIVPLVDWARKRFSDQNITEDVAGFRRAFKLRLKTAPGVVATGDAEIGPSLILHNTPVPHPERVEGWDRLEELVAQVKEAWLTPNGDEIQHAIHTYKWLYELTAGFYNELTYPDPDLFARREETSLANAEQILDTAQTLYACQQDFHGAMRKWIDAFGRVALDTPLLVKNNMFNHKARDVGVDLHNLWREWHALRDKLTEDLISARAKPIAKKDLQERLSRCLRDKNAVRVCPFKINQAVQWVRSLKKSEGAIVWVKNIEMGLWLRESLYDAGIDIVYCPAGPRHNRAIKEAADANKKIIASLDAHHVGKNLQALHKMFYLQWPRAAKLAEQSLGRMHRNGQLHNEVWAHTNSTTEFDTFCMAATLVDSLYIHQSTGNRQKLIYCTYSTLPKIFPPEVLRERGFRNKELSPEALRALRDRFGEEIT